MLLILWVDPIPVSSFTILSAGSWEPPKFELCQPECLFPSLVARGDHCGFVVTGDWPDSLRDAAAVPTPQQSIMCRLASKIFGARRLRRQKSIS